MGASQGPRSSAFICGKPPHPLAAGFEYSGKLLASPYDARVSPMDRGRRRIWLRGRLRVRRCLRPTRRSEYRGHCEELSVIHGATLLSDGKQTSSPAVHAATDSTVDVSDRPGPL
jgi:hypothetical protein